LAWPVSDVFAITVGFWLLIKIMAAKIKIILKKSKIFLHIILYEKTKKAATFRVSPLNALNVLLVAEHTFNKVGGNGAVTEVYEVSALSRASQGSTPIAVAVVVNNVTAW
jgi:hypothetical protein